MRVLTTYEMLDKNKIVLHHKPSSSSIFVICIKKKDFL